MIIRIGSLGVIFCLFLSLCFHEKDERSSSTIEQAYAHLFSKDLGYVLTGKKPMSLEECFPVFFPREKDDIFASLERMFKDSPTFLLRIESSHPRLISIFLIHKPFMRKTINDNPYLKNFVLRKYGSIDCFFQRIQDCSGTLIEDIFFYDEKALGLAFGYGLENVEYYLKSAFFQNNSTQKHMLIPSWSRINYQNKQFFRDAKINNPFMLMEETAYELKELCCEIPCGYPPYLFDLPIFIARKCKETDRIISQYEKYRTSLAKACSNKSFYQFVREVVQKDQAAANQVESAVMNKNERNNT